MIARRRPTPLRWISNRYCSIEVTDWLLFEGTIEANLPAGSLGGFPAAGCDRADLPQRLHGDQAGIFDQPFGDCYEDQSPFWVNRFITAPLPYNVEALVPPTDVGHPVSRWSCNGEHWARTSTIRYGSAMVPASIRGCPSRSLAKRSTASTTSTINTNGQGYGARLRVYPLPLDSNLGRFGIGRVDARWQVAQRQLVQRLGH